MPEIKIATCQHRLSGEISDNIKLTIKQLREAAKSGAEIVHFPECNLTGYAGIEFSDFPDRGNGQVEGALSQIKLMADKLNLWVIIGAYWYTAGKELPYNSLFVINSDGIIQCRYDKRLLTAGDSGDDLDYFSAGTEPVTFLLNGINCGLLICHEWRYPELYRQYKRLGVELIFQSWYDANVDSSEYLISGKDHGTLIMGSVRSNAANNYLWISGSNACNRESSIGSFFTQPDGVVAGKLSRNRSGILISTIDNTKRFIDPSKHNRDKFF